MTNERAIFSQELDALREDIATLRRAVLELTETALRLEYRMNQQSRAMERMAQYAGIRQGA